MAKRKRLTPPGLRPDPSPGDPPASARDDTGPRGPAPEPMGPSSGLGFGAPAGRRAASDPVSDPASGPPIARLAGESAAAAALAGLTDEIAAARDGGRLIQDLPLGVVDADYLIRDRLEAGRDGRAADAASEDEDEGDLAPLVASLRARGQQVPVEVVATGDGRYGLISGWRRLTALGRLHAEAPGDPRFATVQAILRRPETAAEAYLAMVEENEIRASLSYYERARIVARAAEAGVFPDEATALARLFAAASRPKRSKIGSFLRLHAALDGHLRFASSIPERLGLALVRALDAEPAAAARLRDRLRKTPPDTPAAERATLARTLRPRPGPSPGPAPSAVPAPGSPPDHASGPTPIPAPGRTSTPASDSDPARPSRRRGSADETGSTHVAPDIEMETAPGRVTLRGPGVTGLLQHRLEAWLRRQAARTDDDGPNLD